MKEDKVSEVKNEQIITETLAMLTHEVRLQNDIIFCLLHKFDMTHDLPLWTTKEAMEEDVGPKVKACIESVRSLYGHPEIDKS